MVVASLFGACQPPPWQVGHRSEDAAAVEAGGALLDLGPSDVRSPDTLYRWPARFHVSRGFLRDPEGRAVIMRGVNLSGQHKHKPYFDFHQESDFAKLSSDFGMNAVRFLISWAAIEPQKGQYDSTYLDEVDRRVGFAEKAGLHVVLDMHQDVYGEGFGDNGAPRWTCDEALYKAHVPKSPWFLNYSSTPVMTCFDRLYTTAELRQHYAEAWRRVALRLKARTNVVGFDVMNEPHWGSYSVFAFEADRLQPFYNEVIAAVRKEVAWVAFLEPSVGRNMGLKTGLTPFSDGASVYAPHCYDAQAELGNGFDVTHRSALMAYIASLASEAVSLSSALWVGEYGGSETAGGITEYMDALYDGAAAVAASTMYWDYSKGGGYSMLASDGTERPKLMAALVRPYPTRVAGDPVSFSFDEATATFTLIYRPTAAITAPTQIALPPRLYPKGATLTCQGCTHTQTQGTLTLTTPPTTSPAIITLKPAT